MDKCLGLAEQRQQSSIVFSAIGTGNLGFPKPLVVCTMLDSAFKFSSKRGSKHVKEVVFVLHPKDTQTIQVMYDVISVFFRSIWNSTICIFLTLVTIIMSYFHLCNNICHPQQVFTDEFSKRFLGQSASVSASNPTQPQSTGAQILLIFFTLLHFFLPKPFMQSLPGLNVILVDE